MNVSHSENYFCCSVHLLVWLNGVMFITVDSIAYPSPETNSVHGSLSYEQ